MCAIPVTSFPGDVVAAIRAALLAFFDESARDLPWRRTQDPYSIWVSEVMAQQTRVETAASYYERWIEQFPDVEALADAELDTVLKAWEGLGYYSRARNLHSAARLVRERHAGEVPGTYDALRALPGVGEYTAGAVASIAFAVAAPAVDGNVRRVLARLLDEPAPSPARLRDTATRLVPPDRPGAFNQALMELGATICTPRRPRCGRCPVVAQCAAYEAGTQLERPAPKRKKHVPEIDVATAVLRRPDGRVLIRQRPPTGLLAGLWEFPGMEMTAGESAGDVALRIAGAYGTIISGPDPLCSIEHVFSHRRERYDCHVVAIEPAATQPDCDWIGEDRGGRALPRAQQRIHASALAH